MKNNKNKTILFLMISIIFNNIIPMEHIQDNSNYEDNNQNQKRTPINFNNMDLSNDESILLSLPPEIYPYIWQQLLNLYSHELTTLIDFNDEIFENIYKELKNTLYICKKFYYNTKYYNKSLFIKSLLSLNSNIYFTKRAYTNLNKSSFKQSDFNSHMHDINSGIISPNIKNKDGETILMKMVSLGNIDAIKSILEFHNTDINIQDKYGDTALMIAISRNKKDIFRLLLNNPNINVNIKDNNGNTPLMSAIISSYNYKDKDEIEALLEHPNIDVNIRNQSGITPLMIASARYDKRTVRLLLNKPNIDINMQDYSMNTALIYSCIVPNNDDITKLLIDHGADVNTRSKKYD